MKGASRDHDNNLTALLDKCAEQSIKLNAEKNKLRMTEVSFIGQMVTSDMVYAWIPLESDHK